MTNRLNKMMKRMAHSVTHLGALKKLGVGITGLALVAYAQVTPDQPGVPLQTTAIVVYSGTWKYTGPDTAVLNYTISVYPASADADGDGYPDSNAQPALTIPGIVDNTRRVPIL